MQSIYPAKKIFYAGYTIYGFVTLIYQNKETNAYG